MDTINLNGLLGELKKAFFALEQENKKLLKLYEVQKEQNEEIAKIKKQLEGVVFSPGWVPTKKALEMLGIKKQETLKNYSNMGLLQSRRGYDKRNYYLMAELLELPQKLFELQDKKN